MKRKFKLLSLLFCLCTILPLYGQQDCEQALQEDVETPIRISDCAGGVVSNLILDENIPTPVVVCDETTLQSLFLQVHWNAIDEYYGDGVPIPCDLVPIPVCARIVAFVADQNGNKLSNIPFQVGDLYEFETDCREICATAQVQLDLQTPPTGFYLFELQMNCCGGTGTGGNFEVKKTGLLHFSTEPGFPDVDFDFIASLSVDDLNNQGDNPIDGLEPTSTILPGPELGPLSIGVDASVTGGSFLETITYTIEEVSCLNGGNAAIIFEEILPLSTGQQPENYLFIDQFLDPGTGDPWFFVDANTVGKCFKLTVTVTNMCGDISNFSFFTITESCQFCLQSNPESGSGQPFIEMVVIKGEEVFVEEESTIAVESNLAIFPNPVRDKLLIKNSSSHLANTIFFIRSSTGKLIHELSVSQGSIAELDLGEISNGLYIIEYIDGDGDRKFHKFIKQQ